MGSLPARAPSACALRTASTHPCIKQSIVLCDLQVCGGGSSGRDGLRTSAARCAWAALSKQAVLACLPCSGWRTSSPCLLSGPRLRAVDAVHDLHLQAQAAQLGQRELGLGLVAGQRDQVRLPGHLRVLATHARAVAEAVPGLRARARGASECFHIRSHFISFHISKFGRGAALVLLPAPGSRRRSRAVRPWSPWRAAGPGRRAAAHLQQRRARGHELPAGAPPHGHPPARRG